MTASTLHLTDPEFEALWDAIHKARSTTKSITFQSLHKAVSAWPVDQGDD